MLIFPFCILQISAFFTDNAMLKNIFSHLFYKKRLFIMIIDSGEIKNRSTFMKAGFQLLIINIKKNELEYKYS